MFFKRIVNGIKKDFILVQSKEDDLIEISTDDVLKISSSDGTNTGLAVFETKTGIYYAIHTEQATKKLSELIGIPFELERVF